jgi:aminoglycoside phosphotransferase (APT) family kinase protein
MVPNQKFDVIFNEIFPQSHCDRKWDLSGGMSAQMTAFELTQPDGTTKKMIMRIPSDGVLQNNPSIVENEFNLLKFLRKQDLPVSNPIQWNMSPIPHMVLEYIEGQPLFPWCPQAFFPEQIANYLVQIHKIPLSTPEVSQLSKQANRLNNLFPEQPSSKKNLMREVQIWNILNKQWPIQDRNQPVLVHGDFWHGNLIWKENQLVGIIDWEDAEIGSPLFDLAVSRLDLCWISGTDTMNLFTEQYMSRNDLDYSLLPYWDLVAAQRLIRLAGSDLKGWASFFYQYDRFDITEESILKGLSFFVDQAVKNIKS